MKGAFGNWSEPKRARASAAISKADSVGKKRAGLQAIQASSAGFYVLRQLSTHSSSDDDDGGDNSGVRRTNSTAGNRSSHNTAGSSRMDNSRTHNHIGKPDTQLRLLLLQRRLLSERSNAGRAQEVIQLPPMQ